MKLQNNQTGQIENFCIDKDQICSCDRAFIYDSLAQLQEAGWEDYEEPKEFWFVDSGGEVGEATYLTDRDRTNLRNFGNYFATKEEAEKAVEKLKAWKRLKDKGFRFTGFSGGRTFIEFTFDKPGEPGSAYKDLDLLFSEEGN